MKRPTSAQRIEVLRGLHRDLRSKLKELFPVVSVARANRNDPRRDEKIEQFERRRSQIDALQWALDFVGPRPATASAPAVRKPYRKPEVKSSAPAATTRPPMLKCTGCGQLINPELGVQPGTAHVLKGEGEGAPDRECGTYQVEAAHAA